MNDPRRPHPSRDWWVSHTRPAPQRGTEVRVNWFDGRAAWVMIPQVNPSDADLLAVGVLLASPPPPP